MNDYGSQSKIDQAGVDDSSGLIIEDNFGGKPKILKDSSKYVKKKSQKLSG